MAKRPKTSIWHDLPNIRLETIDETDFGFVTFETINSRIHALLNKG
jgi:RNA recognition motif-containing protein